jgi:hypothetical protein
MGLSRATLPPRRLMTNAGMKRLMTNAAVCERKTSAGGWMLGRLEPREIGTDRDFEKSIKNLHCGSADAKHRAAN